MLTRTTAVACLLVAFSLASVSFEGRADAQTAGPAHVWWAEDLIMNVAPEHNDYGFNPTYLYWAGVNGATEYENRTVCNTFVTRVLKQSYGWDDAYLRAWMGSGSPLAATYHDTIAAHDGFTEITTVDHIEIGDIVAIKYPEGTSSSGHLMMVVDTPRLRVAGKPFVAGTDQYEVDIADSANSGHGNFDTRLMPDGSWDSGAGIGTFRLYVDATGAFVGHTWSTSGGSTFYDQSERHLVVGRIVFSPTLQGGGTQPSAPGHPGHGGPIGGHDFERFEQL